jgi:hypothetical protein
LRIAEHGWETTNEYLWTLEIAFGTGTKPMTAQQKP